MTQIFLTDSLISEAAAAISEAEIPDMKKTFDFLGELLPKLWSYGKLILFAVILFIIGRKVIRLIMKGVSASFNKSRLDDGAASFLTGMINSILYLLLIVGIAGTIGIQTSSFVAVIGSAGIAIGLALQGSLSNLAGGVFILIRRPFRVGDYIVTKEGEGTVSDIDIFYTRLMTVDNRIIVIPNGGLADSAVVNVTGSGERMLDLVISVSYDAPIQKAKDCLIEEIKKQEYIMSDREQKVFVKELGAHSIDLGARAWVKSEYYWDVRWKLQEDIVLRFRKEKIEIPYEQLDVHVISGVSGDGSH